MRHAILGAVSAALAFTVSSAAVLAQQANPPAPTASANMCEELVRFLDRRGTAQPATPVTLDQARSYQRANNVVACRDGFMRIQSAGITLPTAVLAIVQTPAAANQRMADAANITVQQPAPTVRVEQASPTINVQQPQPTVTVQQPTPEILVRQPAPTVTVDIPQPEIIVRMPQPDVNVAMAQPQIQVNQPPPQVQVVRPEQPQVQVQPAQPQVVIQRPANQEPNVQVQQAQAQPQVRYERADPKVVVNQTDGQPQVRIERVGAGQSGQAGETRMLAVSDLEKLDVYNGRGNEIGDVENVLVGPNNQVQLVVSYGGFLGVGERRVAMPLNHFRMQTNPERLIVTGPTDEQLKAMPAYTKAPEGYREAEAGYRTAVATQPPGTTAAATEPNTTGAVSPTPVVPTRSFAVSALMDREVYNLQGQQLGDIERVLMGEGNKMFVVLGHGGFLGLGEKQILVPMERIQVRDERLVVQGLTDDQIRAMPEFKFEAARSRYREMERTQNADLTVYRG